MNSNSLNKADVRSVKMTMQRAPSNHLQAKYILLSYFIKKESVKCLNFKSNNIFSLNLTIFSRIFR